MTLILLGNTRLEHIKIKTFLYISECIGNDVNIYKYNTLINAILEIPGAVGKINSNFIKYL